MHKRDKKHHMTNQVKSRKRMVDHGEVFTAEREVKAMCDLVSDECLRIDSRFLEPACGNGNFLSEILARKLDEVAKKYKRSPADYENMRRMPFWHWEACLYNNLITVSFKERGASLFFIPFLPHGTLKTC